MLVPGRACICKKNALNDIANRWQHGKMYVKLTNMLRIMTVLVSNFSTMLAISVERLVDYIEPIIWLVLILSTPLELNTQYKDGRNATNHFVRCSRDSVSSLHFSIQVFQTRNLVYIFPYQQFLIKRFIRGLECVYLFVWYTVSNTSPEISCIYFTVCVFV